MKNSLIFLMIWFALTILSSCERKDDESTANLRMNFVGLKDLGPDYAYEGWLIVDGAPITAGIFDVDSAGIVSQNSFSLSAKALSEATAYVLTIEPSPDPDPAPSKVHILAGNFSGNSAFLVTAHSSAIGTDFVSSSGEYMLATPSDGNSDQNELSGVWWFNSNDEKAGLNLPSLPSGWRYEGWVVFDGLPISTGQFTEVVGADNFNGFSSKVSHAPEFPGEDFLQNAPSGLSFPTDLSSKTLVISVEPFPDNSPDPFFIKPLIGMVPNSALTSVSYNMENNALATNPFGTASR